MKKLMKLNAFNPALTFAFALLGCLFFYSGSDGGDACLSRLSIQNDDVNVRSGPGTGSPVSFKLKKADNCEVLEKGSEETINGKKDSWYRVKCSSKTGWVFGAFTSLRLEGRKKFIMTFKGCGTGDVVHRMFKDANGREWDFYSSYDNFCGYEWKLCVTEDGAPAYSTVGAKKYVGKKFEVVVNDLQQIACDDWPNCTKFRIISLPAVISLKLID